MDTDLDRLTQLLARALWDQGKPVEAGWTLYKMHALSRVSAQDQEAARHIFFAGAQHVYGTMLAAMDDEDEMTEADLRRMNQLHAELSNYAAGG